MNKAEPPNPKKHTLAGHHAKHLPASAPRPRRPVRGGWTPTCRCGWRGTLAPTLKAAKAAYAVHLLSELPICSMCKKRKAPTWMSKSARHLCKACSTARTRAWAAAHPKEWERNGRRYWLRDKYGMTPEQFDALLASQGGCCAICRTHAGDSRGFRPHVDHDHETGVVRGILCHACNSGLGSFRDDANRLLAAVEYLRAARERSAA